MTAIANTIKKELQEEYNRLKKIFDKLIRTKKERAIPQLVLQPVRNLPRQTNKNI